MKYITFIFLCLSFGCHRQSNSFIYLQESNITLAPPIVEVGKVFFDSKTTINIKKQGKNIDVRYTDDGSEPNKNSILAPEIINVETTNEYKFRAFQKGMTPSKVVSTNVFNNNIAWTSNIFSIPNENYDSGTEVLNNRVKGDYNFRSNEWNGYQDSIISFSLDIEEIKLIKGIVLSTLVDQKSWIFSPKDISLIYHRPDGTTKINTLNNPDWDSIFDRQMNFIKIETPPSLVSRIDIKINMSSIPKWHPGKGSNPWFFIDEILIL